MLISDMLENIKVLTGADADFVIISSSSDEYNIDFMPLIQHHSESGRDLTMVYKKMPRGEDLAGKGYCLDIDDAGKVTALKDGSSGW